MPTITFISHDGTSRTVNARGGQSLMEVAVGQGIEAIEAACGGACSCATCHVFIDSVWRDRLPTPSAPEREMLSALDNATAHSRLSCQIKITEQLAGMIVLTPASQG